MQDELERFVAIDLEIKMAECELDALKYERRKLESSLIDQMAMNAKPNALVERHDGPYRVYIRHTSGLRVTNLPMALGSLRLAGLAGFIDESIDTGRLGSFYRKHPEADIPKGLDMYDSYKLYAVKKKQ